MPYQTPTTGHDVKLNSFLINRHAEFEHERKEWARANVKMAIYLQEYE